MAECNKSVVRGCAEPWKQGRSAVGSKERLCLLHAMVGCCLLRLTNEISLAPTTHIQQCMLARIARDWPFCKEPLLVFDPGI